jgi:hypothetical protein
MTFSILKNAALGKIRFVAKTDNCLSYCRIKAEWQNIECHNAEWREVTNFDEYCAEAVY